MIPAPVTPRRRLLPVFVLVAVALVLAGAAGWMFVAAGSTSADADRAAAGAARAEREVRRLAGDADTGNRALTDADASAEVTDQLRTAVERVFSYDHADLDATARAVDRYLTGDARCAYDVMFGQVREAAPAQRIVLRTEVRELALAELTGEEARALVFIDQTVSRGGGAPSSASAQFQLTARLDGDTWQVTSLDFFDQPLATGQEPPKC